MNTTKSPVTMVSLNETVLDKESDWEILYQRIGNNIRTMRTFNQLTQDYMAGELNISTSTYSKIERSDIELTVKRLFQIAFVLNVSIESLIFMKPPLKTNYTNKE